MLIFAGIDGTGPRNDAVYSHDFRNSHIRTMFLRWRGLARHYSRGPSDEGLSTKTKADKAAAFVDRNWRRAGPDGGAAVFLAGYSRGGAAAISTAWTLNGLGIPVDLLLLFDAVDRTHTITSADEIPANVKTCRHAFRSPLANSRAWFKNCGRRSRASTDYAEKSFLCTHGAMGGCPWTAESPGLKLHGHTKTVQGDGMIVEPNTLSIPVAKGVPMLDLKVEFEGDKTNITLAHEARTSAHVWMWMNSYLQLHRDICWRALNAGKVNVRTGRQVPTR